MQLIKSRGTLGVSLKDLEADKLIQRRILAEKRPIESYYSLTRKGRRVAIELLKVKTIIEQDRDD